MEGIKDKLAEMKEWAKAILFDSEGNVLGNKNCQLSESEIQ